MGRILGIDFGTRTLGLAVSDDSLTVSLPLTVIRRTTLERDLAELADWMEGRTITALVIGVPYNLDGSPGKLQADALAFGALVAERFGLELHPWDERMTTVAAERALLEADLSRRRRKQVIDKVAATLILQAYLDRRKLPSGLPPIPEP